jgi:DNA-directed RNA polymerase specialized sigma24 family protein
MRHLGTSLAARSNAMVALPTPTPVARAAASIRITVSRSTSYAVIALRGDTRAVFLLSCVHGLDYALIGRHLGLSVQAVETHMASALCEVTSTIDLIERVRPRRVAASSPEARNV